MYDLLSGLRIVEGASFVAAPSAALHLQQMGAEVIRFDTIGGGPDYRRWPRAPNGESYYWEGLNKGKASVALNLTDPEGRELAAALAAAVGVLVTNYPVGGFLSHDRLAARRADMITVRVMGWPDGTNALDYTVNAALGVPYMTGLGAEPVNHVLPAWDLATGLYAAFAVLAAARHRQATGEGGEVRVPLGDVAIGALSSLGQIAEVGLSGADRPRVGNDIFGAYGRDFVTADGQRVMLTAISARQWHGLVSALELGAVVARLEAELGVTFGPDEGVRFVHRDRLNPLVADAIGRRTLADLAPALDAGSVTWGPYRSLRAAVAEDPRLSAANPMLTPVAHLSDATYLTPGAVGTLPGRTRGAPTRAPRLGEHSERILADVLGLASGTIGDLIDRGIVGVPA